VRALVLTACAVAICITAASAQAHRTGAHSGLISTVSTIDPNVPGLLVRVLDGHVRLSVANLTQQDVYILGAPREQRLRVSAGRTRVWREPRVGANETPPDEDGLIRYWRIPGETGGKRFEIIGFLGYRAPPGAHDDSDVPKWAVVLAIAGGAVLLAGALAVPFLVRRREA
jgi:hypothetical protein